jgi:serine/threonine protein kinase
VVARFEAERQALAMMDHPNIARVLDAGSTDEKGVRNRLPERPEGCSAQTVPDTNGTAVWRD